MNRMILERRINLLINPGYLNDDFIFDVNKSIVWNKEKVDEHNKELAGKIDEIDETIIDDIKLYISEICEYEISEKDIQEIIDKCYDYFGDDFPAIDSAHYPTEVLDFIDSLIDMYERGFAKGVIYGKK